MSQTTKRALWSVVQIGLLLAMFRLFFILAPWADAKPMTEASVEVVSVLPAGCPAFTVNHGQYHCFENGTISQNPLKFISWLLGFLVCLAILRFSWKAKIGFWSTSGSNDNPEP